MERRYKSVVIRGKGDPMYTGNPYRNIDEDNIGKER